MKTFARAFYALGLGVLGGLTVFATTGEVNLGILTTTLVVLLAPGPPTPDNF